MKRQTLWVWDLRRLPGTLYCSVYTDRTGVFSTACISVYAVVVVCWSFLLFPHKLMMAKDIGHGHSIVKAPKQLLSGIIPQSGETGARNTGGTVGGSLFLAIVFSG